MRVGVVLLMGVVLLAFMPSLVWGFTLNVPNVLLPVHIPNTLHTNFTLSADSGCFTWLSTKELVVGIHTIEDNEQQGCGRQAELTSLSQDTDRQLSLILAQEAVSGSEMRVDVFVDRIHKIAIKTTSLELLLEETPSTFDVDAFDKDGNTFSSLEGLEFTWTIEPDPHTRTTGRVLQNILYTDSSYLTPPTIGHLESQGKQGQAILVQGIKTGVAWVKAKLAHPAYKDIPEVSVRVVVIENLLLNPPYDVWVLPLTQVKYKAERRQHGRKTEIQFPSDQYYLKLSNETVGQLSGDTMVTSQTVGHTDVILIDSHVQHLPLGTPPHTTIHVVPPNRLLFKIDGNNWNFEKDNKYTFTISVLGPNNRPVLFTENIRIKLSVEAAHVAVVSSNLQGTQHTIIATRTGSTSLHALLDTLVHPGPGAPYKIDPGVTSSQPVVIRSAILLVPSVLTLPYYPKQPYTFRLSAEGGSGKYTWLSRDPARVSVNKDGVVTGRALGTVEVVAGDVKNGDNSATAQVTVTELSQLTFLPTKVETLLGGSLRLNLAAYAEVTPGRKVPFTRCDLVPLTYTLSNDLFQMENEEKPTGDFAQGVCSILTLQGVRPGFSLLKATYTTSTGGVLSATISIGAYQPLKLVTPSHVPVITLGTSIVLTLTGGPQPWITDKSGYSEVMVPTTADSTAALVSSNGLSHSFRVECLELGHITGLVVIGNKITADNRYPAAESLKVAVRCGVPGILSLAHSLPAAPQRCPFSDVLSTLTTQDMKLFFTVKTADNMAFDNSSSLLFSITSSDQSLLSLSTSVLSGVDSGISEVETRLLDKVGKVDLSVKVDRYDKTYLADNVEQMLGVVLEQNLSLNLVGSLSLSQTSLTMFNYEEGSRMIEVSGGSGHFINVLDNKDIVKIATSKSSISIQPHIQGVTTLTVQDLCLPEQAARCDIHVTGPAEVQIKSVTLIEINKHATLTLQIIDSNKRKISSGVFSKLNLNYHVVSRDRHVTITLAEDQSLCDDFCTVYRMKGVSLGTSTVQFSVSGSSKIVSNILSVTVFPPLVLSPSPLVLVEGAVFQLRYSGGPQHGANLHFTSDNVTTATINQRALVAGVKEGNVNVLGKCLGLRNDDYAVYSQAVVSVEVIKLAGVQIRCPSTFIIEGSEVTLTVWGLEERNPFTFASVPGITFSWLSSSDNIKLNSLYHKSGYSVEDEKQFVVSALGLEQGVSVISVAVEYLDHEGNKISHTDSISIKVIKKAGLVSPSSTSCTATPTLLLGPGASYNIRTNKDHSNTVQYSAGPATSPDIVSVSQDGVVTAKELGNTILQIDVLEDFNINQTLLLFIQVKSPFTILISEVSSKVPKSSDYFTLPSGLSTSFLVKTLDDLGRVFDGVKRSNVFYTLNRMDVITVESVESNDTLTLTGLSVGETIIRVHTSTGMEGWSYIRVSSPLDVPTITVLQGSTVCVDNLQGDSEDGSWLPARSDNILTLQDGEITALNPGVTELRKPITSATHRLLKVEVVKVEAVSLSLSQSRVLSNLVTSSRATPTLRLQVTTETSRPLTQGLSARCGDTDTPTVINFKCVSSHPGVLSVTANVDAKTCVVSALPNTVVTTITPLVTVFVEDSLSSSIKIPFVPRFKLSETSVELSPASPTHDIQLTEGDFSLVQVTQDERSLEDINIIKTSTHFHLALLDWNTESQHSLTFICPSTGQTEVLTVTLHAPAPSAPGPLALELTPLLTMILPTAILGILVILVILLIFLLTTASFKRYRATSCDLNTSTLHSPVNISMMNTPVKSVPFKPATLSPNRLKTPLFTKPRGTPGSY